MSIPPSTVRIGPHHFTVEVVPYIRGSESTYAMGLVLGDQQRIELANDQAHTQMTETLLHECIHALAQQSGHHLDEGVVQALGCGVLQVLRDNPDLVRYVTSPDGRPMGETAIDIDSLHVRDALFGVELRNEDHGEAPMVALTEGSFRYLVDVVSKIHPDWVAEKATEGPGSDSVPSGEVPPSEGAEDEPDAPQRPSQD